MHQNLKYIAMQLRLLFIEVYESYMWLRRKSNWGYVIVITSGYDCTDEYCIDGNDIYGLINFRMDTSLG